MGWSYAIDTDVGREDIIKQQVDGFKRADNPWGYVRHQAVGNHLWFVLECRESRSREACLVQLQSGHPMHGWGYKVVSHRDEADIPLTLLKLLPTGNLCEEEQGWRQAVMAHHAEAKERQRSWKHLKPGDQFMIAGQKYSFIERYAHGGNQITIERESDGRRFRLPRSRWHEATRVSNDLGTRIPANEGAPTTSDLFAMGA